MYSLIFSGGFDKDFSKIKDKTIKQQIYNKILELETRAPIGKKLKNNPYWSIHVNKYRIIYDLSGCEITIISILQRKYDYKDI